MHWSPHAPLVHLAQACHRWAASVWCQQGSVCGGSWIVCHNRHRYNPYWLHLEAMPVDTGWVTPEPTTGRMLLQRPSSMSISDARGWPIGMDLCCYWVACAVRQGMQLGCRCREAQMQRGLQGYAKGFHVPQGTEQQWSIPGVLELVYSNLVVRTATVHGQTPPGQTPGECCTLHGSPLPLSLIRRI